MKYYIVLITVIFIAPLNGMTQQFIDEAVVEYEVKTNIKKTMGSGIWAEMMKENMPQFKTGYYTLSFTGNKSLYKFDHWDEKVKMPEFLRKSDEENVWFYNYNSNRFNIQKDIYGSKFYIEDSITQVDWHLENENRIIAGFNCRKAVGKIMDSVYVFAFYTDEILLTGGPSSVNGLPGLILGLTIPRLYTSFIATKVSLSGIDKANIKPTSAKKIQTVASFKKDIHSRIKEWISEDDDEDSKQWTNQFLWNTFL
ncbi:MAG: GLPGLI family protein [Chitinophagaceae bacterium]|nr:GLPGLI family protein [Chitinophagaceae bacterium]